MPAQILLVDDEPAVLKGWVKALKPTGQTLFIAQTEAEAIKIATSEPIDLIVADYILGRVTGVEVINAVRSKRPLVRTILISGQIDENVEEGAIEELIRDKVEVDLYLHKPVRNKDLREAARRLLANKESVDWKVWAQKAKAARDSKPQDAVDAAKRLNQHLKK